MKRTNSILLRALPPMFLSAKCLVFIFVVNAASATASALYARRFTVDLSSCGSSTTTILTCNPDTTSSSSPLIEDVAILLETNSPCTTTSMASLASSTTFDSLLCEASSEVVTVTCVSLSMSAESSTPFGSISIIPNGAGLDATNTANDGCASISDMFTADALTNLNAKQVILTATHSDTPSETCSLPNITSESSPINSGSFDVACESGTVLLFDDELVNSSESGCQQTSLSTMSCPYTEALPDVIPFRCAASAINSELESDNIETITGYATFNVHQYDCGLVDERTFKGEVKSIIEIFRYCSGTFKGSGLVGITGSCIGQCSSGRYGNCELNPTCPVEIPDLVVNSTISSACTYGIGNIALPDADATLAATAAFVSTRDQEKANRNNVVAADMEPTAALSSSDVAMVDTDIEADAVPVADEDDVTSGLLLSSSPCVHVLNKLPQKIVALTLSVTLLFVV